MTSSYPRPLSPHLQIYKVQLTSLLSILHRGTGMVLYAGIWVVTLGLICLAAGPEEWLFFKNLISSWVGRFLGLSWIFSLYYHMCNGIRHLAWDWGWGFGLKEVYRSGWLVIIVSLGATVATGWVLLGVGG